MRAALYARISTRDKGQDTENQLLQLREYCARQGWEGVEYIDRVTGKDGDREAFKRMFEDASRRKFDVVLMWALDRFSREGVYETFGYIRKLSSYGVKFESYTEPQFRTTGPAGELMIAVAAWIAKHERLRMSERVRAGLHRARSQGTRSGKAIGRPKVVFRRDQVEALRKEGHSWSEIARRTDATTGTVRRSLRI